MTPYRDSASQHQVEAMKIAELLDARFEYPQIFVHSPSLGGTFSVYFDQDKEFDLTVASFTFDSNPEARLSISTRHPTKLSKGGRRSSRDWTKWDTRTMMRLTKKDTVISATRKIRDEFIPAMEVEHGDRLRAQLAFELLREDNKGYVSALLSAAGLIPEIQGRIMSSPECVLSVNSTTDYKYATVAFTVDATKLEALLPVLADIMDIAVKRSAP